MQSYSVESFGGLLMAEMIAFIILVMAILWATFFAWIDYFLPDEDDK